MENQTGLLGIPGPIWGVIGIVALVVVAVVVIALVLVAFGLDVPGFSAQVG